MNQDNDKDMNENSNNNEDHAHAKRLKINENSEFIATSAVQETVQVKESNGAEDAECCTLCMEAGTDESPIIPHQCPQCAPEAWKICQVCNESLLSRICPVCRSDYAPIIMYPMPGHPVSSLADQSLSEEERTNLLYKFGIIRQLISKSNVAIWSPVTQKMTFSLPQKIQSENATDQSYALVTISLNPERFSNASTNGTTFGGEYFAFNNKIWDEIENEVESGEVTAGHIVEQQKAIQSILNITKDSGHKLFTMLSPDDWQYMLDPSESNDTSEALKAIKNTIFRPVMPTFAQHGTPSKN